MEVDRRISGYAPPVVAEVDAGAPHRRMQLLLPDQPFHKIDGKEIPPQVKVGTDPQEPLAQGDECRNVLDPVGGEVLQFHLIVVQQPPEKLMGGHGESPLMEVSKRHDVPFRRLWLLLLTGQPQLLDGGQWAKEASADEALQAPSGDVGFVPWVHYDGGSSTGKKAAASFDGGSGAGARSSSDWRWRLRMRG